MNLSGIAVAITPHAFETTIDRIAQLPGVEVFHRDPDSSRVIVVQEAENVDAEVEGLKQIKLVPGVVVAEMVYHYFAEDANLQDSPSPDSSTPEGIKDSVLRRLSPS